MHGILHVYYWNHSVKGRWVKGHSLLNEVMKNSTLILLFPDLGNPSQFVVLGIWRSIHPRAKVALGINYSSIPGVTGVIFTTGSNGAVRTLFRLSIPDLEETTCSEPHDHESLSSPKEVLYTLPLALKMWTVTQPHHLAYLKERRFKLHGN